MEKIIHPESDPRVDPKRNNQGAPAGRVLIAGLVGLLAAVFLNSAALVTDAKRMPDGASRSLALAIWTPIESGASFLGLTWPRAAVERLLGRYEPEQGITLFREQSQVVPTSEKDERVVPSVEDEQEPGTCPCKDFPNL